MARYFEQFPTIPYNLEDNDFDIKLATNILARASFLREISENAVIAYDYIVKDSDKPEYIAHKLYGDVNRHWMVLLNNSIMNPYYDYPLNYPELEKFIVNKYGYASIVAQTTLHHYEKKITKQYYETGSLRNTEIETIEITTDEISLTYDAEGNETVTVTTRTNLPDYTIGIYSIPIIAESFSQTFPDGTSVVVSVTHEAITVYDYEFNLNEKKRQIRLLDTGYVKQIEDEFKELMKNV